MIFENWRSNFDAWEIRGPEKTEELLVNTCVVKDRVGASDLILLQSSSTMLAILKLLVLKWQTLEVIWFNF